MAESLTLFDAARARHTDPETSHEAARTVNARLHRSMVIDTLRRFGASTDKQLCRYLEAADITDQSIRSRRSELVNEGIVAAVDAVKGDSGRRETVWALIVEAVAA